MNNNASNNLDGFYIYADSNNNVITNNNVSKNENGIFLHASSNYNILSDNTVLSNENLGISVYYSSNNTISANNVSDNNHGIYILSSRSTNNLIYRNTLLNNTNQAFDSGNNNSWDNDYPSGGNYWSDHVCTGNPSNGSEPYYIDADSIDHYPFEDPNGWIKLEKTFDTGPGTYPSIFGTHNGTITPKYYITVSKMYTYPCAGTGGHSEYIEIWNTTGWSVNASWDGYTGDWHNISFGEPFTLEADKTYNYTIRTGSYPQIIHTKEFNATGGKITCAEFIDVNGKRYNNWIPAIKLFL
jgi:parallel beta-helix repeat protein